MKESDQKNKKEIETYLLQIESLNNEIKKLEEDKNNISQLHENTQKTNSSFDEENKKLKRLITKLKNKFDSEKQNHTNLQNEFENYKKKALIAINQAKKKQNNEENNTNTHKVNLFLFLFFIL